MMWTLLILLTILYIINDVLTVRKSAIKASYAQHEATLKAINYLSLDKGEK